MITKVMIPSLNPDKRSMFVSPKQAPAILKMRQKRAKLLGKMGFELNHMTYKLLTAPDREKSRYKSDFANSRRRLGNGKFAPKAMKDF